MCTIICKYNPSEKYKVVFLENRDLPLEAFEGNDVRIINPRKVVCIFDYRSQGIAAGYSLETGLFGGLANIIGYVGFKSRGKILRKVLTEAVDLKDCLERLADGLKSGKYSSARYLIADTKRGYIVENYGKNIRVNSFQDSYVVTNRFKWLRYGKSQRSAINRERAIKEYLKNRRLNLTEFMKLAQSHRNGRALCRHGFTLASILVTVKSFGNKTDIYYSIGNPCSGYKKFSYARLCNRV